jgi:succinyl-diaminopimelate desuccinylase
MSKTDFEKTRSIIDASADYVVHVQKRIVPAVALAPENGGTGERQKAAVVEDELRSMGVEEIETIEAPDGRLAEGGRTNLIATIRGRESSRAFWIMSHLDVVPVGDEKKWSSPPWEARVDGDRIYGRGTEDNGQGIASALVLARALRRAGVTPDLDVKLLFIADEETGSGYGIQYLLKEKSLFRKDDLVVVPDGGEPDGSMIEIAEKSILWTRFTVTGKQTHASTPERGVNAHRAGAALIVLLDKLHEVFDARDPVFEPPISTFEPTKKEANVPNVNTIPGEDVFYVDARILPGYRLAEVKARMRAYADEVEGRYSVKVSMEHQQEVEAPEPTRADSPVVKALEAATAEVLGVKARPMGIGGGTVAAYLRREGIPAAVWASMDETMHAPDEYVKISNVLGDARVFAHICLAGRT